MGVGGYEGLCGGRCPGENVLEDVLGDVQGFPRTREKVILTTKCYMGKVFLTKGGYMLVKHHSHSYIYRCSVHERKLILKVGVWYMGKRSSLMVGVR